MANEQRLRQLSIGGLVEDNPLTAGATLLTSASLAAIANGVSASQYMPITLDPDGVDGAPEVAYITALTAGAGATGATGLLRGAEGTTARQHRAGTPWIHAVTPQDVLLSPDIPWAGDLGYDYEFDGSGSTLPTGWSWMNQGGVTYSEQFGKGAFLAAAGGSDNRGITRALPSQSTWTAYMKFSMFGPRAAANPFSFGFALRESSSGKLITWAIYANDGVGDWIAYVDKWNSSTSYNANVTQQRFSNESGTLHFGLRRNLATSYDFLWGDGSQWAAVLAGHNASAFLTPDQLFIGGRFNSTPAIIQSVEWFRVR